MRSLGEKIRREVGDHRGTAAENVSGDLGDDGAAEDGGAGSQRRTTREPQYHAARYGRSPTSTKTRDGTKEVEHVREVG